MADKASITACDFVHIVLPMAVLPAVSSSTCHQLLLCALFCNTHVSVRDLVA